MKATLPLMGIFLVAVALSIAQAQPRNSRPELFTTAQATRGEAVYKQACASCHSASLVGGRAPALAGPAFARSWGDPRVTLDDLFFIIRTTMPPEGASTLSSTEKADVFAFILRSNGYPAGPVAVAAESAILKQHRLSVAAAPAATAPAPPAFVPGVRGATAAADGPNQATLNAAATSSDWLFHNHDYAGTRYSPLDQITPANASRLAPACMFQVGQQDNFQT